MGAGRVNLGDIPEEEAGREKGAWENLAAGTHLAVI